jgi:hypothetical protein
VLSAGHRLDQARIAEAAASAGEAKDHRARRIAAEIVGAHGAHLVVEDCDIRTWFRLWGKRLQATTPGRLIAAIGREAERTGGRLLRASTFATRLSQTCPCGAEVHKTLADRTHTCPNCGLTGNRDLVSALLAALVQLADTTHALTDGLPWALGLTILLTVALLALATGSLLLPVKAVLFNALGLTSVLGAMVWVFVDGHLAHLLGFTPSPLAVAMPILLACVAYALFMDYEMFLLARIKERHDSGRRTSWRCGRVWGRADP